MKKQIANFTEKPKYTYILHTYKNYFQGIDLGAGEPEWIVTKERSKWDAIFESLSPTKGKVSGSVAKKEMIKSKLPNPVLAKVWRLADVDSDGALDSDEFALAMHLINIKLEGYDLPEDLPDHLVPPSKKRMMNGLGAKKDSFWRYSQLEQDEQTPTNKNIIEPELAITLDFNVKSGSVVKKTSILKEPGSDISTGTTKKVLKNSTSSRETSVAKTSALHLPSVPIADDIFTDDRDQPVVDVVEENLDDDVDDAKVDDGVKADLHDYANENLVKGLESVTPLLAAKNPKNNEAATNAAPAAADAEKIHTLRYSSGGVLSNKPAQAEQQQLEPDIIRSGYPKPGYPVGYSPPSSSSLTSEVRRSKISKPSSTLIRTSDLPYIDESDLELDEAIRDAIGIDEDRLVTRIQLDSTTSSASQSNASTLLVSQRSCSGTDTIHMSEKVIKRDYRDM